MSNINKTKKYIVSLIFIILFLPFFIFGSEIYLYSDKNEVGVGSYFEAFVFIDAKNENINAISGKLSFSQEILELKEIKEGNSIISFWVDEPKVKGNEVVFSGIIPGGFSGDNGLIFSAIFYTKKEGIGLLNILEPRTLLNDGQGTETKSEGVALKIVVSPQLSAQLLTQERDNEPPESFLPEITSDPTMFDGKYFLIFSTKDKGSGIDHYEVCEGKKCVIANSPYLLKNQNLNKEIIIKAVDRFGNERIVKIPPQNPLKWYENWWIWIIVLMMIIVYIILKIVKSKNKSQKLK
jgi:hypothetical protein